jgi:uncharacterized protein
MKRSDLIFPCVYPLKVIGQNTSHFFSVVSAIIEKHVGGACNVSYHSRTSGSNTYASITATFDAQSYEQLTTIYKELNEHELVKMTL